MISHDSVEDDVDDLMSANAIATRDKACTLHEAIDDDQDNIITALSGCTEKTGPMISIEMDFQ